MRVGASLDHGIWDPVVLYRPGRLLGCSEPELAPRRQRRDRLSRVMFPVGQVASNSTSMRSKLLSSMLRQVKLTPSSHLGSWGGEKCVQLFEMALSLRSHWR